MPKTTVFHPWRQLSKLGISNFESDELRRSLVLNNQVSITVLFILFALLIVFRLSIPSNAIIFYWLVGLCVALIVSLYLNSLGRFKFNQLILSSGLSIMLIGATIHSKLHHPELILEGSCYNPRYFLIGLAFLPFVVFELKNVYLWVGIGLNLGMILFYNQIHALFGADPESILGEGILSYSFISVASSTAVVSIVSCMYFFKHANNNYENQIKYLLAESQKKKEEIESSIRYASHLQESIISTGTGIIKISRNTTCLNLPRDIVSGDFHVFKSLGNKTLIATADCTGHGVPAAFVSLLAYKSVLSALNRGYLNPSELLSNVNSSLHEDFRAPKYTATKDGMDISICLIDPETRRIDYSNAKSLLYLLTKKGVQKLNTERVSIGDYPNHAFKSWSIHFEPGDCLVMSSDGFPDQFGGDLDKKFGRKRFEQLLEGCREAEPKTIVQLLESQLKAWKRRTDQTDDICVMVHRL